MSAMLERSASSFSALPFSAVPFFAVPFSAVPFFAVPFSALRRPQWSIPRPVRSRSSSIRFDASAFVRSGSKASPASSDSVWR